MDSVWMDRGLKTQSASKQSLSTVDLVLSSWAGN